MTKKTQQPKQPEQPGEEFAKEQNNPRPSFSEDKVLDNTAGQLNSPSWNVNTPALVMPPVAPPNVEVIIINRKLQDVQQQSYIFEDKPAGKYILEYHYNGTVMPLPVWWSGSQLIA